MAPGQKVVLGPFFILLMIQTAFAESGVQKLSDDELLNLSPQHIEEKKQWEANARVEKKEYFEVHQKADERKSFIEKQSQEKDEYLQKLVRTQKQKPQHQEEARATVQ